MRTLFLCTIPKTCNCLLPNVPKMCIITLEVIIVIKLKEFREAKGWTQRQTAMKAGLAPTTYHNYEKGLREPDSETLIKFAELFGITIDELIGRDSPDVDYKKRRNDALLFALYDGADIEITDEMYEEIKRFAAFAAQNQKSQDKKE